MSRGVGVFDAAQAVPSWLEPLLALATQAGDAWFLLLALAGLAIGTARRRRIIGLTRREVLLLAGLVVIAIGLTDLLKELFALPRPAGAGALERSWLPGVLVPVFDWLGTAHGFGFPSGHALIGTVFYGGIALLSDWGRPRTRGLLAVGVIGVVGATRVLLGVHYVVDILVGVGLAGGLLWIVHRVQTAISPLTLYPIAGLLGGIGILLVGPADGLVAALALGASGTVGLLVAEHRLGGASRPGTQ